MNAPELDRDIIERLSKENQRLACENENLAHLVADASSVIAIIDDALISLADRLAYPQPLTDHSPKTR